MADTKKKTEPGGAPEPPAAAPLAAPTLADPAQVPMTAAPEPPEPPAVPAAPAAPSAPPAVAVTVAPNGTVTNQIGGR